MKPYLISAVALLIASCSGQSSQAVTETPKDASKEMKTATAAATGATAVTTVDGKRFWVSFGPSRSWTGGHTPPATDVLPVTSGKYVIGADALVLQTDGGKTIGRFYGFTGITAVGQTGRGAMETSAETFRWTAI